ncbi:EAL domain-containing protein [Campylobacter fetus]|nr:EAL domain-containing protein [Campylobacter fetus]
MYQPVVNIKDAKIISFEVLLRWRHPQKGIMLPVDFLHIFSDKVWFDELTIWIIINALRDSKDIFDKGIKLSINIPFEQLNDEIFFSKFKNLYESSDLRFDMLEIEITDAMSVKDIENEILNLTVYEELGIKFIFDDFGSSLSLASTMKTAPTNTYKINKKYALELLDRVDNVDMLQTILNICNAFNKRAVIKGVENEYIYNIVANMGFVELQGNFISKPVFKDDILDTINMIYIKRVFNPNLEKISLYKFIIYQINAIKQIIIAIENYNTSIFDYSTYRRVYNEFEKLKEIPEPCKEADGLITLVFSSDFVNKEEIAYLLNELEHKKLSILNTIIGE